MRLEENIHKKNVLISAWLKNLMYQNLQLPILLKIEHGNPKNLYRLSPKPSGQGSRATIDT